MNTYIVLFSIFSSVAGISIVFIVKHVFRKRFPARVTCWFCGKKSKVPYEYKNCWDCPSCEQYNGFDKDGNYNKPIPSQYDERLNHPITCDKDEFLGGHDILCARCSQNQLLKIKQLANFVPYNEKNFDYEVDAFKQHLEKVYRLCLPCEIKVQRELEIQNEAISRRLGHLDCSRSFMQQTLDEPTFLHASYTEKKYNKLILTSIILHTVSLVCSILLAAKEVNLDGPDPWQKTLLFIHPALLWLDMNAEAVAGTGLVAAVVAKLCLGKYRLHIIDAVSCPVWLLVLLAQTGSLTIYETGSVYHVCSLVLNVITCSVGLGIKRNRRNQTDTSVIRVQLDNSRLSDSVSSVSPYSSVSQVAARSQGQVGQSSRSQQEFNERSESPSVADSFSTDSVAARTRSHDNLYTRSALRGQGHSPGTNVQRSQDESRSQVTSTTNPQEDDRRSYTASKGLFGQGQGHHTNDSSCYGDIADTATELNAVSLGEPSLKRNDSGIFSTVSQSSLSSNLNGQSVGQNLHARKLDQGRPLISPAAFKHSSTPESHRSPSLPKFGLFSIPSTTTFTSNFPDRPASPSAFSQPGLFSSQRHSFTPERPSSPVITSFGQSPFKNVPLQSDRLSQISSANTFKSSFTVAREPGSLLGNQRSNSVAKQQTPVARKRLEMAEISDSENEDDLSDITSISRRRPLQSAKLLKEYEKVPWWRQPGFVGFILGGSVVANIMLAVQAWYNN